MKIKKFLSLTTVTALILSLFSNISVFVSAEPANGCYIDFSQYNFDPLTKEGYDEYKSSNPNGTPTAGNMYDVNIYDGKKMGTYSLVDDSTAVGGKYLNYVKDSGGINSQITGYVFAANPTGNYATNGGTYHTVLTGGDTYSMKIRYRVDNLESEKYNLNLIAGVTGTVATPNSVNNKTDIKKGIANTNGWIEETYTFTAPATQDGRCNSLLLGFEPRVSGLNSRPANDVEFTYNLSVDYIEIREAVTPQHMEIDFDNYNVTKVSGSSGSIANDDDALWLIDSDDSSNNYMSYHSSGEMTKGGSLPYGFMANPTGSASYADRANAFILENGAEYRVSFKYRLSKLHQSGTLTFKVGATAGSNCMNSWSGANTNIVITPVDTNGSVNLSSSEEWKTVSYTFTMTTTYTNTDVRRSMQVAFVPNSDQKTVKYIFDVDDIVVDRLSSVTVIDENGNKTIQKGAPATPKSDKVGFGGNAADKIILDSASKEVYSRPTAECIDRTEYYYDSAMTRLITSTDFPVSDEIIYSKQILKQSSVNQVSFCGFDEYGLRSTGTEYGQFGKYGYINTEKESVWEIVDGVSYTGTKSMHMALSNDYSPARKFLYIGNSYEYEDNVSYHVSLRIKKDTSVEQSGNLKITLGGGGDVYGRFISGGVNSVITIPANELSDEWTEYSFPVILIISLILAIILNQRFKVRIFFRALYFMPVIIASGAVLNVILSSFSNGVSNIETDESVAMAMFDVNEIVESLGLPQKLGDYFVTVINGIMNMIWNCGVQTVLFISGMQTIPPLLYEVSKVEGATKWEEFWFITFPMLSRVMVLVSVFTMVELMTAQSNSVMMQAYTFMRMQNYGEGSAMLWSYFLVIGVIMAVVLGAYNRLCVKRWE